MEAMRSTILKLKAPGFPRSLEGAFPFVNPFDLYRLLIAAQLQQLTAADPAIIFASLKRLSTLDKGDLTAAVPALRCKDGKPADQAKRWAEQFLSDAYIQTPVVSGVNLTFFFNAKTLPPLVFSYVFNLGSNYGFNETIGYKDIHDASKGRKKVVVEFSSPNIAKEFHQGHLRSTIIGAFLSNLYSRNGWEVVRMNYLGDWGRQYGLLAVAWEKYGSEELLATNATKHLFDIYVKISQEFKPEEDAYKLAAKAGPEGVAAELESKGLLGASKTYFRRMENGDPDALTLWNRFRNMSIERYKQSYGRLNVVFDVYSGESQVDPAVMRRAEEVLKDKGISSFDAGATIVNFTKFGAKSLEVAIIRNRTGATTYLLRDVGAAIQRYEQYGFDEMIYVIMSEQKVHVQRLIKLLDLMGGVYQAISKKMVHVEFGKVQGMSTRRGTVKFLEDVLDECASSMHEVMKRNATKYEEVHNPEAIANTLGISAVMVQDMKGKRINNYPFDIERMTSFEGDTGPYLQYAHARLCSILRKADYSPELLQSADFSLLTEDHAVDLIRLIAQFPDIIGQTLKTLEPTTVLTYLFRLTHQVSSSYDDLRVVYTGLAQETSIARAALYSAARQVLNNGMTLLGMVPVERM